MFFTLSLFLSFSVTSPPARQFARCSYPLSRSPICAAASSQDVRPHDKPAGKVVKTRCGDGNLVIAKGPIQAHAATGCLGRGTLGLGEWGMELTSRKRNTCLWTMTEMSCIMPFIVRKPWLFFLLPVYRYASPTQPPPPPLLSPRYTLFSMGHEARTFSPLSLGKDEPYPMSMPREVNTGPWEANLGALTFFIGLDQPSPNRVSTPRLSLPVQAWAR